MKKPWSISTTVRNPERLRGFLGVLKTLEGESFNSINQIKYQILLIQNKLYKPINLSKEQMQYFDDIEKEMIFSVAEDIFNAQKYEDPAMRGRNSVAPLNKMGLCVAKNTASHVEITSLGKYFLSDDYDLGKLFFLHFLKWQLPNPDSKTFNEKDGFAIKPFIGTLQLIYEVNRKWEGLGKKPIGISKDEFSLFALTLIHYRDIARQAGKVIDFRKQIIKRKNDKEKRAFTNKYKRIFAAEFLETNDNNAINSLLSNLKDYGDNAIRYFRLTRYIHIRGGGFYIDLESRRNVELKKLIETDNASPLDFKNVNEYRSYIADLTKPILPWETDTELQKIATSLKNGTKIYTKKLSSKNIKVPNFNYKDVKNIETELLKQYIETLRIYMRKLQEIEVQHESQSLDKIIEYINLLKNIHKSKLKKSIELERLATLALNALNDALEIKPNYPVGDDNEPTFTAPANKPDIECFYEKFNSVCEVTMLTSRSQWYNEGQPVMRHVRAFENTYSDKTTYCLFIAPRLHQDTIETFWMAIKYGYKGVNQKIVPISIIQFIKLLEALLEIKKQGRRFKHSELSKLYDNIIRLTNDVKHSEEWIDRIPDTIEDWQKTLLSKVRL
jgi:hypothetical protein